LDITLRKYGKDTIIAVIGLVTEVCALATVLVAFSTDFYSVIISDCCATRRCEDHEAIISIFSCFPAYPTLRVRTTEEFLLEAGS
jgi:nicotinamidase-related amidase